MATPTPATLEPPLVRAVAVIRGVLDKAASLDATFLTPAEKSQVLAEVATAQAQLASVTAKVLALGADVAELHGTRDAAAWLASVSNQNPRDVRREARLAARIDTGYVEGGSYPDVGAALAEGRIGLEQARVIVNGLDRLPDHLNPDIRVRAEARLLNDAAHFNPDELHHLARHILDVVAPEVADDILAKQLAEEEQSAMVKPKVTCTARGDGTSLIRITAPDLAATRFMNTLHAYASPRRHRTDIDNTGGTAYAPADQPERRDPYPRRLGHAFCHLVETFDPNQVPHQAGDSTTLMITVTLDALRNELATATLNDHTIPRSTDTITAHEARRLACNAKLIPVVLGSDSVPLDLGRTARLHSPHQRKALRMQHSTCQAERCTIPATWCEAHHESPWAQGGHTNLNQAALFCAWHHHRAHDPHYETSKTAGGVAIPPTAIAALRRRTNSAWRQAQPSFIGTRTPVASATSTARS